MNLNKLICFPYIMWETALLFSGSQRNTCVVIFLYVELSEVSEGLETVEKLPAQFADDKDLEITKYKIFCLERWREAGSDHDVEQERK